MRLLCLSNGHGEDVIAVKILQQLQKQSEEKLDIYALPLVGEGRAYTQLDIPIIGDAKTMPSGGFIYMDSKQAINDIKSGLLKLTASQYKAIKNWAEYRGKILAVGDIIPLLFAWLSGLNYAFVGTAKSEYYIRDEEGILPRQKLTEKLESYTGSVYLPWERFLMLDHRCKGVFARDKLTTDILHQWYIPAHDFGNPMMDDIKLDLPAKNDEENRFLTITLLPGSRSPEAYENWQLILKSVQSVKGEFPGQNVVFVAAIASNLDLSILQDFAEKSGWEKGKEQTILTDEKAIIYHQQKASLIISQNAYAECLNLGDFAIAMAGTATEQFIGLGKAAIGIPGQGPQYNYKFAEAQNRLLGPSLILVHEPEKVGGVIKSLLGDPDRLQLIAENGKKRMGLPGSAAKIAAYLLEQFNPFPI